MRGHQLAGHHRRHGCLHRSHPRSKRLDPVTVLTFIAGSPPDPVLLPGEVPVGRAWRDLAVVLFGFGDEQVCLGHDPDEPATAVGVGHRNPAHPVLVHQPRQLLERGVRVGTHDLAGHHVRNLVLPHLPHLAAVFAAPGGVPRRLSVPAAAAAWRAVASTHSATMTITKVASIASLALTSVITSATNA